MHKDVEKILYSREEITRRVKELGAEISKDYTGKNPVVIGVLKGAFVFMADLVREIEEPCQIDFIAASSYGNSAETSGTVKITKDIGADIKGRHVLLIEDILDTGVTLSYLKEYMCERGAETVKICAMLDKPARRQANISADYCGFECPDAFIVGYGLDYAEQYRNFPYIGELKAEIYS